ncbi:hypothetical protein [Streptomyces flaveolus]|uniref:hypothetical protein n=1 Tax=Streptomyces flaveolus TaxID=67297 RepID=UPI0033E470F7
MGHIIRDALGGSALLAITSVPGGRRVRTAMTGAAGAAVALMALAGCGSGAGDTEASGRAGNPKPSAASASSGSSGGSHGVVAAALVGKALDATFGQDYLSSTRRTKSEGTTTLRVSLGGDRATCEAHSRKGSGSLDFVVTESALYTRGSREGLGLSPEAKADPVWVDVMADRWVKRGADMSEAMREMCESTTRRTWLEKRVPPLDQLSKETPIQQPFMVQGRPATKITFERAGGPLEFQIAAEGVPFLLRVTYPATDLDESFSDFGEPFRVVAPPAAVSELQMAQEVLTAQ